MSLSFVKREGPIVKRPTIGVGSPNLTREAVIYYDGASILPLQIPNPMSKLLKDRHPDIFAQIDRSVDYGFNINTLTYGSNKKVLFICNKSSCGHHRWEATINHRTSGNNCPFCAGKQSCLCTQLSITHPKIFSEIDKSIDYGFDINKLTHGSRREVWFVCNDTPNERHRWKDMIQYRVEYPNCRYCKRLAITHPEIFSQIDKSVDYGFDLNTLTHGSGKKVRFICDESSCEHHRWDAYIYSRTNGQNCPFCSGHQSCECTQLPVTHPKIFSEIDKSIDYGFNLNTLTRGSHKRIWFICLLNSLHRWKTSINHRTRGNNCPFCSGRGHSKLGLEIINFLKGYYNDPDILHYPNEFSVLNSVSSIRDIS
jgi:hypothetical protein